MVCPVFHFIQGNLMKVKVKVKSSSAYDCCRKNIYIFRIIRGTGMWYIGIPIKDSAIQKSKTTTHKPDILPTVALYTFGLTIWHMNGLRYKFRDACLLS